MTLVRWRAGLPPSNFFDEALERFIRDVDDIRGGDGRGLFPTVDIVEKNDSYIIRAEVPGLGKDDVNVELKENTLKITGEKKEEHEEKDTRFHRVECSYGKFERAFYLPQNIDQENIKASFNNGVLSITVNKKAEAQSKKIEIAEAN